MGGAGTPGRASDAADARLTDARTAHDRCDWAVSREWFARLRAAGGLDVEDLVRLGTAQWWLGEVQESLEVAEEVYRRRLADRLVEEAAQGALELAQTWVTAGDTAIGQAWLGRARQLLSDHPRSRAHGYLAYVELGFGLEDDAPLTEGVSREIADAGVRFDDPALRCLALVSAGLTAVHAGDVERGFDLLDEAMLPVLAGSVPAIWSGDVYCSVVHVCEALGDTARMRAWTEAMESWATPLSRRFTYYGVSRVHRLQLCSVEGDWGRVERELSGVSRELAPTHGWVAGEGYRELGDVRRLVGDTAGAEVAYGRARDLGIDPQPGEALMLLAEGRGEEAASGLRAALTNTGELGRARMLPAAVEVALAGGHHEEAEQLAARLARTASRYASAGLAARADLATARVLGAGGDWDRALEHAERAGAVYREQHARYALAQVHEVSAVARRGLGDQPGAAADAATALAVYRGLGARPDAERLLGGHLPGGLTAREVEVLACIASGAANHQVAEQLVISDKTVARHLANIYLKIGVSSRTAAAVWAHDHGVSSRTAR